MVYSNAKGPEPQAWASEGFLIQRARVLGDRVFIWHGHPSCQTEASRLTSKDSCGAELAEPPHESLFVDW
jgi:hypothetical protein